MTPSGITLPTLPPTATEAERQMYLVLHEQFGSMLRRLVSIEMTLGLTPSRIGWVNREVTEQTGATYTVLNSDYHLIANRAGTITYTLPAAASNKGRELVIRTITANTAISAASDVVPLVGGAAGTAILAATAGKWALLVSDGSSWQIMAGN